MTNIIQTKLVSKCFDPFNFSPNAKIRVCKGVVLSSLALSVAYALHSVYTAYQSSMERCTFGSSLDCTRASGNLIGVLSGIVCGTSVALLPYLIRACQSQPKPSSFQLVSSHIHSKDREKYETIIQIAKERRNILVEIAQLKKDSGKNEDKSAISKLTSLIALNEELEKKQSLLWKQIDKC